jgi:photosystem II stability/assembly factor-like uncharacterized protein
MTSWEIIAGTADGIRRITVSETGIPSIAASSLEGQAIRGIAIDPRDSSHVMVAAGLRGWGLHASRNGGQSFESVGFEDYWCWDVVFDPGNSDRVLVGTEPPMLWESMDSGNTWSAFQAIDNVSSRPHWTFFHAPFFAGHLHGIALSSAYPDRILVGVEHGGLLRSIDRGQTWVDVLPGADVHRIVVDPHDPDLIWAGLGNGLYTSTNGGVSWNQIPALAGKYTHGVTIDHSNSGRMFIYVDNSGCPIYRTLDGGSSWEAVGPGLPTSRPADPISLHPFDGNRLIYAGDTARGSTLYLSDDGGEHWKRAGLDLPKVWRLQTVRRSSEGEMGE